MNKVDPYFEFLCDIVGRTDEYSFLLAQLHAMEYYSLIPNDDNRGEDGKQLRQVYLNERGALTRPLSLSPDDACTVLEMLVGLSFRLEFETLRSKWEKTPGEWFWILIDNLELTDQQNDKISRDKKCHKSVTKVSQMLKRDYDFNGQGVFSLSTTQKSTKKGLRFGTK